MDPLIDGLLERFVHHVLPRGGRPSALGQHWHRDRPLASWASLDVSRTIRKKNGWRRKAAVRASLQCDSLVRRAPLAAISKASLASIAAAMRDPISASLSLIAESAIYVYVNRKHRATLARIFARQVPADLAWRDIEALFRVLGAEIEERAGSRVVVKLHHVRAAFHRPHPKPDAEKGAVRAVRAFLQHAGVKP